jgi:N,N-dimethylformamidase beta subunit-like protein
VVVRRLIGAIGLAVLLTACQAGAPTGPVPRAVRITPGPEQAAASTPAALPDATRAQAREHSRVRAAVPRVAAGTRSWRMRRPAVDGQVAGFTTRVSGPPGARVGLAVSTASGAFRVAAYRIGAYRGGDGLLVWRSRWLPATLQPGATFSPAETRTVVAPWHRSLTVRTGGWTPGFYLFDLTTRDGWQSQVPYVVRSASTAGRVVLMAPTETWQAYDDWGGYDLYHGSGGDRRSWAVSYDRPYPAPGAGEMRFGVVPFVTVAERAGVPLAYLADVDLDTDPHALAGARAFVSIGHDEYWTRTRWDAVLRARAAGTNLAFFGADTAYWKVRLTLSGEMPRTVVGYRSDAGLDPLRTADPRDATGAFRDDPATGPESTLTGLQYECFPVDTDYRVTSPRWWGFRGTHVRDGTTFPHLVGVEADRVHPVPSTPRPLQVLSSADYDCDGVPTSTQSVYYTARSGAGVFTAGTLRWTCALVGHCRPYDLAPRTRRFTRMVTLRVLRVFAAGPAGRRHPAHDNVGRFALSPVNSVPAS